jgi:uncharacterized lipoprotein YmbA
MMPTTRRLAAVLAVAGLLAACGSTPRTEYYLLSAEAPPAAARAQPAIGIAELKVAEYLQRPEMVIMESANRLSLRDYHRWAEPLADGVQRTVALNLGALLETDGVRVRPWPREWSPQWLLRLSIARLDVGSDVVELVANWSLAREGETRDRSSRLTRSRSGTSADAVASDISALLLELSERIAAEVRTAGADDAPPLNQ